jgi:hypothetical protein
VSTVLIVFWPGMPGWLMNTLLTSTVVCAVTAALLYVPEFLGYMAAVKTEDNENDSID